MADSFPRQQARTRRFTLGAPRNFTASPDGSRVLFVRSASGSDPIGALWELEMATGAERLVADPTDFAGGGGGPEPAEERARRERRREQASGIVAYSTDRDVTRAAFALAGELWVVDLEPGVGPPPARRVGPAGAVFDPRLDPTGRTVAYVEGQALKVVPVAEGGWSAREVAAEDSPDVAWGQAEFVAAEEMGRDRGFWWAPDGSALLAARVDTSPVATWWIAEPAQPDAPPRAHRYPQAGTADAEVSLHYLGSDGTRREVTWDRSTFPYLVSVTWTAEGPPLLVAERRDHRAAQVLAADVAAGTTRVLTIATDPDWVDAPAGVPAWLPGGRLLWAANGANTSRLTVDGQPITPVGLQVRAVAGVEGETVVFTASSIPEEVAVWRWRAGDGTSGAQRAGDGTSGAQRAGDGALAALTTGGVAAGWGAGPTVVVATRDLSRPRTDFVAVGAAGIRRPVGSRAEVPLVDPEVRLLTVGDRQLRAGVVFPRGHEPGLRLPVILCPYGGPGAQMVLAARSAWLEAQWIADQGFAVVVVDGRGTPGRGPAWARTVKGDLAGPVLEDQVDALAAAAAQVGDLDLGRVGIRGWSFGGYLAALAVLRRPDVFHAAVAGAPVTDWTLYDTYYTERFLDHPATSPDNYRRSGLLDDAAGLRRPLLIVHGMADDNVVVAHSLRLSRALFEAGRPHQFLPLSGVTHMASGEDIAEHLLELQIDFLRRALG